jgi:hypothetical protein
MTQVLLIPAYFDPTAFPALWTQMQTAPIGSIIVMNPASGPGSSSNPAYVSAVAALQGAGMKVVGYIDTAGGGTTIASVEAQVNTYISWYGVNGVFFDNASTSSAEFSYYSTLYTYVHGTSAPLVVLNHGAIPNSGYLAYGDVLNIFEGTYAAFTQYVAPTWAQANTNKIANIVYATSSGQLQEAAYLTVYGYAQSIYITNGSGANPYSALPSYWTTLLSWIAAGASLGAVLQWFDGFETYPAGSGTLGSPWTSPGDTIISTAIFYAGTQSLGVGTGGFAASPTRAFPQGDVGPIFTVDMFVYIPSGNTVPDPPVSNSPIMQMKNGTSGGIIELLIGGGGSYYIGSAVATANTWFSGSIALNAWHRFTLGVTMAASGGTAYLIVDGGAVQTFSGNTQTNASDSVVNQFLGIGQLVVGSPTAEAYMDNVSIYRGAFTPTPSGGAAPPFFHMIPAGILAESVAGSFFGPIPGIAAAAIGASLKLRRLLRDNRRVSRRKLLRRMLDE